MRNGLSFFSLTFLLFSEPKWARPRKQPSAERIRSAALINIWQPGQRNPRERTDDDPIATGILTLSGHGWVMRSASGHHTWAQSEGVNGSEINTESLSYGPESNCSSAKHRVHHHTISPRTIQSRLRWWSGEKKMMHEFVLSIRCTTIPSFICTSIWISDMKDDWRANPDTKFNE